MESFLMLVLVLLSALSTVISSSNNCGILASLKADPHNEFSETGNSLQAQWIAKDTIMVIASNSYSKSNPTQVWLGSKQQSTGLYIFQKHGGISEAVNTQSLKVSEASLKLIVVVSETKQKLYVTTDNGITWLSHSLPDTNFDPLTDFLLSPVNPSHMTLLSKSRKLYVSEDHGQTWKKIADHVLRSIFVTTDGSNEFIFYSTTSSIPQLYPLYRYNIKTRKTDEIDKTAYRFFVDKHYLFVSRQNYTTTQVSKMSRRFYVSTNFNESHVTFSEVQLPAAKWQDYVTVMGTHETGAFIHISQSNDKEKGNLYVSDKSGIVFTLSLKNHLFKRYPTVFVNSFITYDDFYEVQSMRGVYITTVIESNSHYSVITFNNGGSWQKLTPPKGSCSGCSLHLHIFYSKAVNFNLNVGPLSVSNAVGVIIAHGHVGPSRNYDPKNAKIVTSKDGGYTWNVHEDLSGTFSYGIGDYGNIIAAVSKTQNATTLWFSHDRGTCFKAEDFDTTMVFHLSKNFIMDSAGNGMHAFAIGLEGAKIDDMWKLIDVDFSSILSSPCHPHDYMLVTEHNVSNTCILGYKSQYKITKPTSVCYNDNSYSAKPVSTIYCNCNYTDMECDFGFKKKTEKNGHFSCLPDNSFNLSTLCPPGQDYYSQSIAGYRLIAGDQCKKTSQTDMLVKKTKIKCTSHEKNSGYDTQITKSATHTVLVTFAIILIAVAVIALAILTMYLVTRCHSRRNMMSNDRVVYKKVPLNESGASECSGSSSDEDLLN